MIDIMKQRDKILSELFNNKGFEKTIKSKCYRKFISDETYISNDILQEVFKRLSEMNPEHLVNLWNKSDKQVFAVVHSIINKNFLKKKRIVDFGLDYYPKHNMLSNMLYTSNLKIDNASDSVEENIPDYTKQRLVEHLNDSFEYYTSENIDSEGDLWTKIESHLTDDEAMFLKDYLYQNKDCIDVNGEIISRKSKEYRVKVFQIKERIKEIVIEKNIELNGRNK